MSTSEAPRSAETDYTALTDDEREAAVEWCHRWRCSQLADDYCGCSFDNLDRDMADRLIETVIGPLLAARLTPVADLMDQSHWVLGTMPNGSVEIPLPYVAVADVRYALGGDDRG